MAGRQARPRLVDSSTTPTDVLCFCTCGHSTAKMGWICSARWHTHTCIHTYIHISSAALLQFHWAGQQAEWAPRNACVDAKVMKAADWKNALVLTCLASSSLMQKLFWFWSTAMKLCCFWFVWCRANCFVISYWTDIWVVNLQYFTLWAT